MTDDFDFGMDKKEKKPLPFVEEKKPVEAKKPVTSSNSSSPEEQARRFEEVLNDPPVKGYGNVEVWSAKDKAGNDFVAMPHKDGETHAQYQDGKEVDVTLFDPLFEIDLLSLFQGQLAEVPMNVIPNLMDEFGQLVSNEEKDWKPDKAKRDWTHWYWIIVFLSFIPMIIVGITILTGMW